MQKYVFTACVALTWLLLSGCRQSASSQHAAAQGANEADVQAAISETFNQASPDEVAALLKKSAGLKEVNTEACTLLSIEDVAGIVGVDASSILQEQVYHQPNKSTCVWTWNNGDEALALRVEFNDFIDRLPNRYANYFEQLKDEGEWAEPLGMTAGAYKYEEIKGPGDQCLWASPLRSLKTRLGNAYCLFISVNHQGEQIPLPEADLSALRKLMGEATRKLAAQ
jgi:hypothetical protein